MRALTTLLVLAVALLGPAGTAPPTQADAFLLEVPELDLQIQQGRDAILAHRFVNRLLVHVRRSTLEVPYGGVHVRLNGEAANIIMSVRSSPEGILCDLNLNHRPGFLLQPGRNTLEAWARTIYGRFLYSSFLLDVQNEPTSPREIQVLTEVRQSGARPPAIRLTEPQGPIEHAPKVVLRGYVSAETPELTLSVNGKTIPLPPAEPLAVAPEGTPDLGGSVHSFETEVVIESAADGVELVAYDGRDSRTQLLIPVIRGLRNTGERYAVIIGISSYRNRSLNLHFAADDAAAIRTFLLDPQGGGVRRANMLYLTNEDATASSIRTALFTFLTRPSAEDLVFVYFAGHGVPDPRRPQNLYLLPWDTDLKNIGGTAVPMWELQAAFETTIKGSAVAFVDACHSAGVGEGFQNLIHQEWSRLGYSKNRAVLTASNINEYSQESDVWGGGHGAFTYFVLRGLHGEADANKDRDISVGELFDFVREAVVKATGELQTPTAVGGFTRGLLLTTTEKPADSLARLWATPQEEAP